MSRLAMTYLKCTLFITFSYFIIRISYSFSFFKACNESESCRTPNDEEATCISLYHCSIFLKALADQDRTVIEFIRQSTCGWSEKDPLVCCGSSFNFTIPEVAKNNTFDKTDLLPGRRICGKQQTDDRVYSGYTAIDEFPWMALLKYEKHNESAFLCGGTLITSRYVVTAAHCVSIVPGNFSLVAVRLGEYDLVTTIDCVNDTDILDCSEPVVDVLIEKIVLHPAYRISVNDIALIRLKERVTFSDYIRPICLPVTDYHTVKEGDILTSSGWGINRKGLQSHLKKRIKDALISNEDCKKMRRGIHNVSAIHMCSIGTSKDFVCIGDEGGPLMSPTNNQWFLDGIVSMEAWISCGTGAINIHTRVSMYIDWILNNMSP